MTEDERIPVAVWSGTFRLFGVDVRCYVLDDGQRIMNIEDTARVFAAMASPTTTAADAEIQAFARWRSGMDG